MNAIGEVVQKLSVRKIAGWSSLAERFYSESKNRQVPPYGSISRELNIVTLSNRLCEAGITLMPEQDMVAPGRKMTN